MTKTSYENSIAPHLDKIETMLADGASQRTIYETLGISKTSWYKAKANEKDLKDLLKNAGKKKEKKVSKKLDVYIDRKRKAEQKLEEALDNGADWAIRYVLDTYEEHTPYHKVASIKLRELEIELKKEQGNQQQIIVINNDGSDPVE